MKPLIHSFENETEFLDSALNSILKWMEELLNIQSEIRIGLAGGSTPKKLYELLSKKKLPWHKIIWVILDERCVPADDEESNFGMIQKALFASVPKENQVVFDTTLPPNKAAEQMDGKLRELEEARKPLFDLLILGAGKDGHIASLFEGDVSLFSSKWAYATKAPKEYKTKERLTVSLEALSTSRKALLLLKGSEKKPVVKSLEKGQVSSFTALKHLVEKVATEVFFCT